MVTSILVLTIVLLVVLFFIVGCIVGWLASKSQQEYQPVYTHPEMFDENGNLIPDEILAIRFEKNYDLDDEEQS